MGLTGFCSVFTLIHLKEIYCALYIYRSNKLRRSMCAGVPSWRHSLTWCLTTSHKEYDLHTRLHLSAKRNAFFRINGPCVKAMSPSDLLLFSLTVKINKARQLYFLFFLRRHFLVFCWLFLQQYFSTGQYWRHTVTARNGVFCDVFPWMFVCVLVEWKKLQRDWLKPCHGTYSTYIWAIFMSLKILNNLGSRSNSSARKNRILPTGQKWLYFNYFGPILFKGSCFNSFVVFLLWEALAALEKNTCACTLILMYSSRRVTWTQ